MTRTLTHSIKPFLLLSGLLFALYFFLNPAVISPPPKTEPSQNTTQNIQWQATQLQRWTWQNDEQTLLTTQKTLAIPPSQTAQHQTAEELQLTTPRLWQKTPQHWLTLSAQQGTLQNAQHKLLLNQNVRLQQKTSTDPTPFLLETHQLHYDSQKQQLFIPGFVKITQNQNWITGNKMQADFIQQRYHLYQHVKAHLLPHAQNLK